MGTTIIEESLEECENKAADLIHQKIKELSDKQERVILGLSDCKNLVGLLKKLEKAEINWKNVHIFMIDERCVSLNSLESNYRIIDQNLIQPLITKKRLPNTNTHPFIYNPDNAFGSLRHYENEFKKFGGKFDILILNVEDDGHIASLFKENHTIKNEATGFFLIQDSPKPPTKRISSSKKMILQAKTGILFFAHNNKSWEKFNDSKVNAVNCPAKLITQLPESYVFKVNQ